MSEVRAIKQESRSSHESNARAVSWIVLALVFAISVALAGNAFADTAGPRFPTAGANNTGVGTRTWSSTGNIVSSNNSNVSASMSRTEISNYIFATGFGFTIPTGATINGISVSIERRDANTTSSVSIRDSSIMILKGGAVTGANHANTTANWPTSDTSATYGSTTDLWGATWTAADINATNFGVALSASGYATSGTTRETAYIDGITVTVTYTPAAACTVNAATVTLTPASQTITTNGGSAAYTATIRNNDSGTGCSSATYTLGVSDSNSTNFNASTLGSSSITLAAGATSSAITLTVSAISGQTAGTDTTTVTASAAGHTNGTGSVNTTLSAAASCTVTAPALQIAPVSQAVAPSGTAGYTVTVTNNDSAACSATSFNLAVAGDSNSADFAAPSTLAPVSLSLNPGQSGTSTLSVVARATAVNNASNTTGVQAGATGHTAPPNVSVTTTVSAVTATTSALLHNSANLASSKWSGQGGWGVAGGVYGAFVCETCHTRGATNIKGIKQTITVPDATKGTIPGSSVIFSRVSGSAASYSAGQGVFGDDTSCSNPAYTTQTSCTAGGGTWSARAQSDRICEVCHTMTSYHRYNTAVDPDGTGPLTAQTTFNHNNAADCIGCHPHNKGFKSSGGDCYACHTGAQGGTRRAVVNDTTGGDFRKTSHHVTNNSTTQIVNKDVCLVCHGDLLADKGHPGTHPADPAVDLKDPDTGVYVTADEAGVELVCSKCHDANGATRAGLPAGATAAQPFNLTSMTTKDTNSPVNINWTAGQQAHSYTAAIGAGGCLACHGNAAAAGTSLDPRKNAHGSDQFKMMQFAYSAAIAAYPAANASNYCYNCHGNPVANGAVNNILSVFSKTRKHSTAMCSDCHNQHRAKAGNHTAQANTAGGVLNGVAGAVLSTNPAYWVAPAAGNFTQKTIVSGTDAEAILCFKCHSAYSSTYNATSPSGAYAMTNVAREFNPNNTGNYAVTGTASWASGETAGSFHPVLAAATNNLGRTNNIVAPWTTSSLMTCSDCHASDATTDPNGPHGSAANFILKGPNTTWNTTIAATSTGMPAGTFCINCHNQSFTNSRFTQHASRSDHRVACANCHVMIPHGSEHPGLLHSAAGSATGVPVPTVVNSAPYMRASTGSRLYIKSYPANNTTGWSQSNCGCNGTSH